MGNRNIWKWDYISRFTWYENYGVLKNNYKTFVSTINMLEDSKGKQSLLEAANLYNVTFVSVQIPVLLPIF